MQIKEYILKNEDIEVHICNYGGIIKNIYTRDCNWKLVDIVLGFDDPEQYVSPDYLNNYPYLGTTIGRYANRIHRGEITLNGQIFSLEKTTVAIVCTADRQDLIVNIGTGNKSTTIT